MSEQKSSSFMEELDLWCEGNVIVPLIGEDFDPNEDFEAIIAGVKKAIRAKVLESYRNGQHSGPRPAPQAMRRVPVAQRR